MRCPAGGVVLLYLTQGSEPLMCGGSPGLLLEQHRPAVWTRFPQFHPGCVLSPGGESWGGDLEVFHFRAVFSCRLQSLFA